MKIVESIEEIKKIISENEKVLLFVGDSFCSTSRALDQKLEDFSARHKDVLLLQTQLVALPSLAGEYMIFTAPVLLLFKNGKEVFREGKFLQFDQLETYV